MHKEGTREALFLSEYSVQVKSISSTLYVGSTKIITIKSNIMQNGLRIIHDSTYIVTAHITLVVIVMFNI